MLDLGQSLRRLSPSAVLRGVCAVTVAVAGKASSCALAPFSTVLEHGHAVGKIVLVRQKNHGRYICVKISRGSGETECRGV